MLDSEAHTTPDQHSHHRITLLSAGLFLAAGAAVGIVGIVAVSSGQYLPPGIQPPATQPGAFTTLDLPGSEAMPGSGGVPGGAPGGMPGNMTGPYASPPSVGIRINLADGQTIDLRANDIVLTFPGGGSVRATNSGLLPILPPTTPGPSVPTLPTLPPAVQWSDSPPAITLPLEPPATPGPAAYVPIQTDPPAGVSPNTGGIQPPETTTTETTTGEELPGSSAPR